MQVILLMIFPSFIVFQIAHVIREIRMFQQTPYSFEHNPRVGNYILSRALLLGDEDLYQRSLAIEPRSNRLSSSFAHSAAAQQVAAAAAAAAASSSTPSPNP